MASVKKRKGLYNVKFWFRNAIDFIRMALFEPRKTWFVALLLCSAELFVNIFVIWKIKCNYFAYLNI